MYMSQILTMWIRPTVGGINLVDAGQDSRYTAVYCIVWSASIHCQKCIATEDCFCNDPFEEDVVDVS